MSKYITIFEIDAPVNRRVYTNKEPGIWQANLTPGLQTFTDEKGLTFFYGDQNNQRFKVESLAVDTVAYTETASLADLRSQQEGFYWDQDGQIIYINFTDSDPPALFTTILIGAALGYASQQDEIADNVYDGQLFPPRLKAVPNFSKDRDSLFFGILQYGGGQVQLANEDGFFDDFSQLGLFGQPARIYQIEEGGMLTEAAQLFEGVVGKTVNDFSTFTINLRDKRDSFARSLPVNGIATAEDNDEGQLAPLAWGSIRRAPAYLTTTANTWKFCDTTFNAVSATGFQAYYDGNTITTAGTVTDGTFTYTLGAGETAGKVTVDFEVTGFSTGLDILKDIFDNYLDIPFTASNYNLTGWNDATAIAKESAVYVGDSTSIRDIIEQITTDNQGVLDIQDDGKITFKIFDDTALAVKEIVNIKSGEQVSEIGAGIRITRPVDEYLTSCEVGYDRAQSNQRFKIEKNTDFEAAVFAEFKEYRNKRFNTGLVDQADAEALALSIMNRSKEIAPTVEITTYRQNFDLEILDFVVFNLVREDGTGPGLGAYEVLGYTRRITDNVIDLRMRLIPGKTPEVEPDEELIASVYDSGSMVYDGGFTYA